ncbi:MAG: hypothetical protein PWQ18_1543 [Clostridia bacterium]|nr:hypothetical protein [Clostridia bacterium]
MPKKLKVDFTELLGAFECGSVNEMFFLDLETGEILYVPDSFTDPEEHERLTEEIDANFERYLRIPYIESYEGYADMEDFISEIDEAHVHDLLEVAIQGKGAFRRFKDVLARYPACREKWFKFKEERDIQRVKDWLEAEEIVIID